MKDCVAHLTALDTPWLFQARGSTTKVVAEIEHVASTQGIALFVLSAARMSTIDGIFDEFASRLRFPPYFGHNSGAFDECLTDLSWIKANGFCIIILDAEQLLAKQPEHLDWFMDILESAGAEWSICVEKGEWWDRPPMPFHVIFHIDPNHVPDMQMQIAALPVLERAHKT